MNDNNDYSANIDLSQTYTIDISKANIDSFYTSFNTTYPDLTSGTASFGQVKVNGVDIMERLDRISDRLAIIERNFRLEECWPELRELGERYKALEAEIEHKEYVWNTLSK